MNYRSLAFAIVAFSSMHVASADAQSVYVAPGGVYVGSGPVYVIPAPNNGAAPYAAPTYGYDYGPPAVVAPVPPPPAVVAPTTFYGPNGGYNGGYYNGGYYNGGYYGPPLSVYAAEPAPRPPGPVPYYGRGRCGGPYGYGHRGQYCY